MDEQSEINRGYIPASSDGARSVAPPASRLAKTALRAVVPPRDVQRVLLLPALMLYAVALLLCLRLAAATGSRRPSAFHEEAAARVPLFVTQYPLHLYPILAKAFELAYLESEVGTLLERDARFLELAIGEGTLSARLFREDAAVIGMDITPYSLRHAAAMPHVATAVVCDCLAPPVRPGTFDVIVANNFLHHVTRKEEALERWAALGQTLVFNESSPYWSWSWPRPFLQRRLGLGKRAARQVAAFELDHLQYLEPIETLDDIVRRRFDVRTRRTYFEERTFFLCGIFSSLMRCTGPPTPPRLRRLFLGPLRGLVRPLTRSLAVALIRYDDRRDRKHDVYVSYTLSSRDFERSNSDSFLVCAHCGGELDAHNRCRGCGRSYAVRDGMLFLLSPELEHIEREYRPEVAASVPAEHL